MSQNSGIEFNGADVRRLNNPCVYMFMRDGKALYVGFSAKGLQRVFSANHKEAGLARKECDNLQVLKIVLDIQTA